MFNRLYVLTFFTILKHWKQKPLQLFLMIVGLTTATALWNSVHFINLEARKAYSDAQTISDISTKKTLISEVGKYFNDDYFGELRQNGWPVTPRLEGKLNHFKEQKAETITIIGIDALSSNRISNVEGFLSEFNLSEFLGGSRSILSGYETAKTIQNMMPLNNIKPSRNFPEGYLLMDISIAQQLLQKQNKLTSLQIIGTIPKNLQPIKDRNLKIHFSENKVDLNSLTKSFHLNLTAFGLLSYLVALFIVYSTINLAFEQRKGILKSLRSLGVSSILIINLLLFEIFIIAFTSGILGVVLSYFLASVLLPDVAITLNGLFGADIKSSLSADHIFWRSSLGISIFGALFSSVPTFWKSLSLNPIQSAKKIAWFEKTKINLKYQCFVICFFLVFTVCLLKFSSGLISAFILLGLTLILATLALPIFLWILLSLILKHKFKSPLTQWFFADCKQQINSLSVSLMALLLALAVNIGVGGMVESFKKTFIGWLDQRLVSELYIQAKSLKASEELKEFLSGRVEAILPIVKVSQTISNMPVDIYGFAPHETYEKHWPLLYKSMDTWSAIKKKKGLIINEQLSRRLNLKVSEMITFESKIGNSITLQILGIYSDYGNPKGQLMLPLTLFNQYFPDEPELSYAIRVSKNQISKVKNNIQEKFLSEDLIITDQTEIKDLSKRIFEKTFTITAALSVLTLGVAGMALFTAITTLGDNRKTQLAPLWSIGAERNKLAQLETLRCISLSVLTFVFAVPIGLAVIFILTNYVNVEAFGWKLPIFFFPIQWILLGLVTIIITVLATSLHSIKLALASPADLLRASQYDT